MPVDNCLCCCVKQRNPFYKMHTVLVSSQAQVNNLKNVFDSQPIRPRLTGEGSLASEIGILSLSFKRYHFLHLRSLEDGMISCGMCPLNDQG